MITGLLLAFCVAMGYIGLRVFFQRDGYEWELLDDQLDDEIDETYEPSLDEMWIDGAGDA